MIAEIARFIASENLPCISNRLLGLGTLWKIFELLFLAYLLRFKANNVGGRIFGDHPKFIWQLLQPRSCCWRVIGRWSVIIINSLDKWLPFGTFVLLSEPISCYKLGMIHLSSRTRSDSKKALITSLKTMKIHIFNLCSFFRVKQTRFERSLWKGTFGFFPTQLQLRPKLVTILRELLLHGHFFPFFCYIAAIEAQIGDNTKELLLHPFLPFLFLHSCNWGPNWWQH